MHWDDLRGQRSHGAHGWLEQPVVRELWPLADEVAVHHISLSLEVRERVVMMELAWALELSCLSAR